MTTPFQNLAEAANADPNIQRLGRTCSAEFGLGVGARELHVIVRRGRVIEVLEGPFRMRATAFHIAAETEAWEEFLKPTPKPGRHDIFAMSATGIAKIEGNMPILLQHLGFFKALLAAPRPAPQGVVD